MHEIYLTSVAGLTCLCVTCLCVAEGGPSYRHYLIVTRCIPSCCRQALYERYEAQPDLSRRTMKARLLWDAILESQVCGIRCESMRNGTAEPSWR